MKRDNTFYDDSKSIPYYMEEHTTTKVTVNDATEYRDTVISIDNITLTCNIQGDKIDQFHSFLTSLSPSEKPEYNNSKNHYNSKYQIVKRDGVYTIEVGFRHDNDAFESTQCRIKVNPNKCFSSDKTDIIFLRKIHDFTLLGFTLSKFDIAYDVAFPRSQTHFGFQKTRLKPYDIMDAEYVGDRCRNRNDGYTKIYEKAPDIVRIEMTIWNTSDGTKKLNRHQFSAEAMGLKVLKKLPIIYFSCIHDQKKMSKEIHTDRFYIKYRSNIETLRASQNPCKVIDGIFKNSITKKTISKRKTDSKSSQLVSKKCEVDNTIGNDPKLRKRLVNLLISDYGLTQFVISEPHKTTKVLTWLEKFFDDINNPDDHDSDPDGVDSNITESTPVNTDSNDSSNVCETLKGALAKYASEVKEAKPKPTKGPRGSPNGI